MTGNRLDSNTWHGHSTHACLLIAACLAALASAALAQAAANEQATVRGGWAPRLDGNLASFAGEWADATPITLASKSPPYRYQVWLKHDGQALWIAWQIEDPTPDAFDRAVILTDTDHDAAGSPWPDDRRLEVTRTGQSALRQGNGQSWSSSLHVWESKSLDYSSGWSIEVRIPLSQLGAIMSPAGFMAGQSKSAGMAAEYFDVASSNQTATGSWPPTAGFTENSPSTWGSLLLQGASATTHTETTLVLYLSTARTTDQFTVTQTTSRAFTVTITQNRTTTIDLTTTTTSTRVNTTTILTTQSITTLVSEKTTGTMVWTVWTTTSESSREVPLWASVLSLSLAVAVGSLAALRLRRTRTWVAL